MNPQVLKAYVDGLGSVVDQVEIRRIGYGAVSDQPKYGVTDKSVAKLIKVASEEIGFYRERLFDAIGSRGLFSIEEVRGEIRGLIEAGRRRLEEVKKESVVEPENS